jgi:DNA-binding transcriptional LysR family regulator
MADVSKLDYQQLRVFDTLLEERSVTKTAKRLGLTQPTVSAVLKKLRRLFDDPVFVRAQRGVTPTVRAESMAPQIREILDRIESLGADPVFDPDVESRQFSIVARDFTQLVVMVPFIEKLVRDFPKVSVVVHALPMAEAVERMASSAVDLSISSIRFAPAHLQQRLIFKEPYVCTVDPNSQLAAKSSLTIDDLREHGHVSTSALSLSMGDPVTEMFASEGIKRVVKVAVDGFLLVPRILQGTDYIAVVPESVVRCSNFPLKAFAMPIKFPDLRIALLWNQRVQNEPGNCWLREQITQLCEEREASLQSVI